MDHPIPGIGRRPPKATASATCEEQVHDHATSVQPSDGAKWYGYGSKWSTNSWMVAPYLIDDHFYLWLIGAIILSQTHMNVRRTLINHQRNGWYYSYLGWWLVVYDCFTDIRSLDGPSGTGNQGGRNIDHGNSPDPILIMSEAFPNFMDHPSRFPLAQWKNQNMFW